MKEKDLLDSLFEKARNEQPQISLEQTVGSFEKSIAHSSMSSLSRFFTLKNIVIMITTSIIASSIIYLALPAEKESIAVSSETKEEAKITVEEKPEMEIVVEEDTIFFSEKATIETVERLALRPLKKELNTNHPEIKKSRFPNKQKKYKTQDAKRYPVLTEEEIKANHKRKLKMIKSFRKLKNLSFIPSDFLGANTNLENWVQGFYISKTEVTNAEYRTFLFDLLIQGKKAEFDIAKPNQEEWVNYFPEKEGLEPMQFKYFSHPAYDNYPVVNVPPAGATLFCQWLRKSVESKYSVQLDPIRLPTTLEWILAATASKKHETFPWDNDSITNENGCYLANFKSPTSDGSTFTAKVDTYMPNSRGLFNMAGNVSELCYNYKTKMFISMGGSWNDSEEYLKIYKSEQPFNGNKGNPTVGFRVVQTYTRK